LTPRSHGMGLLGRVAGVAGVGLAGVAFIPHPIAGQSFNAAPSRGGMRHPERWCGAKTAAPCTKPVPRQGIPHSPAKMLCCMCIFFAAPRPCVRVQCVRQHLSFPLHRAAAVLSESAACLAPRFMSAHDQRSWLGIGLRASMLISLEGGGGLERCRKGLEKTRCSLMTS